MSYSYSSLDKKNSNWFINDNSRGTLASVSLTKGKIRGLHPFKIEFEYPISAIAGVNGSGKSTILAIASCAFHNHPGGFTPPLRKQSYYTFRDFFIQSADETPLKVWSSGSVYAITNGVAESQVSASSQTEAQWWKMERLPHSGKAKRYIFWCSKSCPAL